MKKRDTPSISDKVCIDPSIGKPLYLQVTGAIKERIAANTWQHDEMISSENELSAAFGISVGTVKKALGVLVEEGVLYRRQGKGTFVARPDFNRSFLRFFRYGREGDSAPVVPTSRVIASGIETAPKAAREALGISARAQVIRIRRIRLLDRTPFILETIFLPYGRFKGFETVDISRELLYPIYARDYGFPVTRADEFLRPEIADAETGRHLGIDPGAAVIQIDRIAYTHGDVPVEFRSGLGRGDRFRYHIEIK